MEEFLKTLSEELKRCMDRTGKEYFITQHVICKNNDTMLHSIEIKKSGERLSKNIYAEPYFYLNMRGISVKKIAEFIVELYNDRNYEQHLEENLIDYTDYDAVKEKLIIRLVSRELNDNFLADKVKEDFFEEFG